MGDDEYNELAQRGRREPGAEIRAAAQKCHELFTALIDEGFTEPQALLLIGSMFRQG